MADMCSDGTKNIVRNIGLRSTKATGDQSETFLVHEKIEFNSTAWQCCQYSLRRKRKPTLFWKLKNFQNLGRGFSESSS